MNDVASLMRLNSIDRFQSRGQQLCKLLGVKPGGEYCNIWAIYVCAAVKGGMVFKQFTLT